METYIKNLQGLSEFTGIETEGEEIGYGERAVIFSDSNCKTLQEFLEKGEFGTCFKYYSKILCKVRMDNYDAEVVYEDKDGDIIQF